MERYKVIVIKKYVFDLDGKDKKGVMEQLDYIINETKLLDMPYVKKDLKVKIKKIRNAGKKESTNRLGVDSKPSKKKINI